MKNRLWLVSVTLAFSGCDTPTKTAEKKIAADDEYILVTVTGSNIPKRVRKSDITNGTVAKDVDTQLVDKDDFAKQMRPGRMIDRGN